MQKDNEYSFDEIVAMLPDKRKKRSVLDKFLSSLAFISIQNSFKVVDIQQYLKIGYGDTARIIDALVLLGVIEKSDEVPIKYIVRKSAIVEEMEADDVKN